jgi:hypothetical protein
LPICAPGSSRQTRLMATSVADFFLSLWLAQSAKIIFELFLRKMTRQLYKKPLFRIIVECM